MPKYSSDFWEQVYTILVEEAQAQEDERSRFMFYSQEFSEYRFMGSLGFGGKIWNNANYNGVPYVTCYSENENVKTLETIDRTNKRLVALVEKFTPVEKQPSAG